MASPIKSAAKEILGNLPLTAEVYWHLRQSGKPLDRRFTLQKLNERLPELRAQAVEAARRSHSGKRVLIFSVLHYWISHATLMGLALAGLGHEVTLLYLPFGRWQKPLNRFDTRRQNLYARQVLSQASPLIRSISLLDLEDRKKPLPPELVQAVEEIARRDTQYTLQVEEVSLESDLYRLRLTRNIEAASGALAWIQKERPDVVVVPNGSILEFGAVYQAVQHFNRAYQRLPVVTYEFGEQRQRIWLAQDGEVMRQRTDALWAARGGQKLSPEQVDQMRTLFAARQKASVWENFARRWQGIPSAGGEQVRASLGLDQRPVVLLATNVIGDSLTLGRQVFSDSMTAWLERTVRFFAQRSNVQLVVRIHPGELITKGPSVADLIHRLLPDLPEHIHLVGAADQVNTYDLIEITDLGLVYTTTVGLEMAMSGLPVITIGQTHYRGKGFTLDPDSWETFFELMDQVLADPVVYRLTGEQVERAWEYAYRFFFEFPLPFPWHLVHLWKDLVEWPAGRVLGEEGQEKFGDTFRYLVGDTLDWSRVKVPRPVVEMELETGYQDLNSA